ncbi:hypothetical protein [Brachyspira sp.]|uniref:hypothetical protein n=1 Tax=Brachyspira sp. TaxID=1977261 RepID=UPI003D7DFD35
MSLRGFVAVGVPLAKNRSNPNLVKFDFYNLISLINKFYTKWIATPMPKALLQRSRLAMTMKNKFEIISQLNYGFCYKNYFFNLNQVFRNSYDFGGRFGRNLNYGFDKDYNRNFKKNCDYGFEKNCSGGLGKNYFGNCNFGFDFGNEICSIWHDLKGFLFNRKILKTKI